MTDEDERDPLEQLDGPQQGGEPNASPSAHKQRVSRIEREEKEIAEFWHGVMSDSVGRRVIWKFLAEDCHAFETRFPCGPTGFPHSEATWFQAGQQEIGQRLHMALGKNCRDLLFLMHDEHDPNFKAVARRKKGD